MMDNFINKGNNSIDSNIDFIDCSRENSNIGDWILTKRCSVFEIRRIQFINPITKKEMGISKRVVVITNIRNLNYYEDIPEELRSKISPLTTANIERICRQSVSR